MTNIPPSLHTLSNSKAMEWLCSDNLTVFHQTIDLIAGLSKEDRSHLKDEGFDFEDLFRDIVFLKDEGQAKYILDELLQKWPSWQVDIHFENHYPLHDALHKGSLDLFDILMRHGADPSHCSYHPNGGTTSLLLASVKCNLHHLFQETVVDFVLDAYPFDDNEMHQAMYVAVQYENLGALRALIKHGATFLNESDAQHTLYLACTLEPSKSQCEMVSLLLQDNNVLASIQHDGEDGAAPALHLASYKGNIDVMALLVEKGACVNGRDNDHQYRPTAIMMAALNSEQEAISWLLEHGADPHLCDTKEQNVLHWLSSGEHMGEDYEENYTVPCARILLNVGVSLDQVNNNGDTPIDVARKNDHKNLEAFFLSSVIKETLSDRIETKTDAEGCAKGLGKLKM